MKLSILLILKTPVEEQSHWRIFLYVQIVRPISVDLIKNAFVILKEGTVLFTIPRLILLSTRTSTLPRLLGKEDWNLLDKGWTGLILCMMYEEALGEASRWCAYLRDLPTDFDTLIYWSEDELDMLQASTVRSKFTFL